VTEPTANPPAGWYPDPANPGTQRYWDGQQWTEQSAPSSSPSAGWYPDPANPGSQRYWDGQQWTEQRMPGLPQSAAPTQDSAASPGDDGRRMTGRMPRAFLIGVAALIVLGGAGAAAYLLFVKGKETCVSSGSGKSVDCGVPGAVSEQEYQAQQAREAQARQAAKERADRCRSQVGNFLASLQDLDSRLSVGVPYAEYSHRVGNTRVAYDQIPFKQLAVDCLGNVGVPAEHAMNSYLKADTIWNDCISSLGCDVDSIDPQLQQRWTAASNNIQQAQSGLHQIAQP
jgi:Protein of unknown function (DUF2510)